MSDLKIQRQDYKSEWHGWEWGTQVMELNQRAEECRVTVNLNRNIGYLNTYISILGCMASTISMAITIEKQKTDIADKYRELSNKVITEERLLSRGKRYFNFMLVRDIEQFHDFLKQQIQAINMGIPIVKTNITKKQVKAGLVKK